MIITFSTQKGGSGKTTLSIYLADAISKQKRRVLLVDADPQSSVGNWAAARTDSPPFTVIGMAQNTLHRDLPEFAKDYHYVLIDCPPRVSAIARSAILASDLVIIPVQPSSYDIWVASETVELVNEAKAFKPGLKAAFLINRKVVNSVIGEEIGTALADFGLPLLPVSIAQRIVFAESSAGYTVLETSPNSAAAKEIKALSKAILKFIGEKSWQEGHALPQSLKQLPIRING